MHETNDVNRYKKERDSLGIDDISYLKADGASNDDLKCTRDYIEDFNKPTWYEEPWDQDVVSAMTYNIYNSEIKKYA